MIETWHSQLVVFIRQFPADEFWLGIAVIIAGAVSGFWTWFRYLKRARLIEDTPTSKCRSAAQGYVELIGLQDLMPGEPIRAPLTGRRCTWWEYCIQEKRVTYSKGRRRTRWVNIDKACSESLFLVRDDTGEAIIDPDGADVTPSATNTWYGNSRWPQRAPRSGSGMARLFGGRFRYIEKRMHEGDPVYAMGFFETRSAHHESLKRMRETAALLAEWKRDQAGLVERFDADGNGMIDGIEWEKARRAAHDDVALRIREHALEPGVQIMSRPTDGRPFILSVLPQTELTRRFRRFAAAGLLLFFISGAATAFSIGVRVAG